MLDAGFYAIGWEGQRWKDLVQKLVEEGKLRKAPERMGMITLVRKLRQREKLPDSILVLNFDRAMYEVFWLNGGEGMKRRRKMLSRRLLGSLEAFLLTRGSF
jgi:hypothetical protein